MSLGIRANQVASAVRRAVFGDDEFERKCGLLFEHAVDGLFDVALMVVRDHDDRHFDVVTGRRLAGMLRPVRGHCSTSASSAPRVRSNHAATPRRAGTWAVATCESPY